MSLNTMEEQESTFDITPIVHGPEKKCNFGAIVTHLNLNDLSDKNLLKLKEAIWTYKLLVIKDQKSLDPKKNWEVMTRLDPEAPEITPASFMRDFHPTGEGLLKELRVTAVPGAENIHIVGKGYQGEDHFGVKHLTLRYGFSNELHAKKFTEDDLEDGNTRFQGWHFDAPVYKRDPALFISFRTVKLPTGPDQQINWDDGSGLSMKTKPGRTAYFSSSQLYDLLSNDEKIMADNSWVEYMYFPFEWNRKSRFNSNGMGVACEGRETPMEEMEKFERDPSWTRKYPMVWLNPLTKEKSFMVQPNAARKLYIRNGPNETPRIIDDLAEVRSWLYDIQVRVVRPEYICTEPKDEGDLLLWDNRGMMHTRIDYPIKYGSRSAHQAAVGSGYPPVGPEPIPADA